MLPASNRLRRSDDYRRAVRSGRRVGRRTVVLHFWCPDGSADRSSDDGPGSGPARIGFVVSKAVGGAVLRNRVHRRLRAVMAAHLSELPPGSMTVVRALPAAAGSTYQALSADVASGLHRVLGPR